MKDIYYIFMFNKEIDFKINIIFIIKIGKWMCNLY